MEQNSPNWKPESLRQLRLRLGLSQCDLARQLSISTDVVRTWEEGSVEIANSHMPQLELLFQQAEMCSYEMYSQPLAESELEKNDLDQIESSTI